MTWPFNPWPVGSVGRAHDELADERTRETVCDGSDTCRATRHVHGCFADTGNCDEPNEYHGPAADTGGDS